MFSLSVDNKLKAKIQLFWDMKPFGLLNNLGYLGGKAASV
jgi:hypothetical protein